MALQWIISVWHQCPSPLYSDLHCIVLKLSLTAVLYCVFQFYVSALAVLLRPQCSIAAGKGSCEHLIAVYLSFGISATVAPCSPVTVPMGLHTAITISQKTHTTMLPYEMFLKLILVFADGFLFELSFELFVCRISGYLLISLKKNVKTFAKKSVVKK